MDLLIHAGIFKKSGKIFTLSDKERDMISEYINLLAKDKEFLTHESFESKLTLRLVQDVLNAVRISLDESRVRHCYALMRAMLPQDLYMTYSVVYNGV